MTAEYFETATCRRSKKAATAPASDLHHSSAVSEVIRLNIQLMKHGKQQIRHRCVFRIPDMTSQLQPTGGAAGQHYGKWRVIVLISIPHGAAVDNNGMV